MTNNVNLLKFDSILMGVKATHTKQVFKNLAQHVHRLIGIPEETIISNLMNFEKEISSGIGGGVSIPHMRLPRLTRPMIIFSQLSHAVDFKANDGELVDIVCFVLSPEFEGSKHLQRLAMVTRIFNDKKFCTALRNARDKDDVRLALKDINAHRVAA